MEENNQTNQNPNAEPTVDQTPNEPVVTGNAEVKTEETVATVETSPVITEEVVAMETPMVAEEVVETTAPETALAAPISAKRQVMMQYGVATLIILLMGAGLAYALEQQGRINTGVFTKFNELVNPAPAAAVVNGVKISQAEYDKSVTQLTDAAAQQGNDVANDSVKEQIKTQAIDVLINTELLKQAAQNAGIVVTPEQVESRYQEIVTSVGGTEQLAAKMLELKITEESLRKDIEGEILIQTHLQNAVDVSTVAVSEQELKDAYKQITASAEDATQIPPLESIKSQLEDQLKSNKQQELVNTYITSLRGEADVKVLI